MNKTTLTITLEDKTIALAKAHAIKQNISLSQFITNAIKQSMASSIDYEQAMHYWFSRKPSRLSNRTDSRPDREMLYDRIRRR